MCKKKGFLVVYLTNSDYSIEYFGIDNNPFPIGTEELSCFFSNEEIDNFEAEVDNYLNSKEIALIDLSLAKKYYNYCQKKGEGYRLLYIELCDKFEYNNDVLSDSKSNGMFFLGYDVGECSGDYYSAILNDILWRPSLIPSLPINKLNKYGLFKSINDAYDFLIEREHLKANTDKTLFESGTMRVLRIYQM